jgi:hypothetical protein
MQARYGLTLQGASAFARISSEGTLVLRAWTDQHQADLGVSSEPVYSAWVKICTQTLRHHIRPKLGP